MIFSHTSPKSNLLRTIKIMKLGKLKHLHVYGQVAGGFFSVLKSCRLLACHSAKRSFTGLLSLYFRVRSGGGEVKLRLVILSD